MLEKWSNLFIATAGVAGALLGLMFVVISISISKLISIPHLPKIALQPINLLLVIIILSIFMLIPAQHISTLGIEITITGAVIWITTIQGDIATYHSHKNSIRKRSYIINIIFSQITILPIIIAGVRILLVGAEGVYWLVPGIILSFIKVVINSWGLLVEINR